MSIFWGRVSKHHELVERHKALIKRIAAFKKAGYTNAEIAEHLKLSESSVRTLLSK